MTTSQSMFLIGIDLGTTNSAIAFVDTRRRDAAAEVFQVPQLTEPSVVEPRPVLPSFLYFGEPHEIAGGVLALPWHANPDAIVGVLARDRGALVPARLVASAKSWLAHPSVDRRAPILPWGATDPAHRISPVAASARYLVHIRDAWNSTIGSTDASLRLERQPIVLTVPASFDDEARELTVEAAREAGFERLTLLEEPIAAFYTWIAEHQSSADLGDDEIALVCDVGGGTTDFSLIRVRREAGAAAFERMAIGDHLLLGGDNVDLALAALVEQKMIDARPGRRLAITQRSALRRLCSAAKERLLGGEPPASVAISVLGAGRSVVGDAISTELTREEVQRTLDGFLPIPAPGEMAAPRDRRAGLRELGLPYETDPAITRHLAAFLARSAAVLPLEHRASVAVAGQRMVRPDLVLFNGGFFTPPSARGAVARALAQWFGETPRLLTTSNLEAAVAIGAATYARLRAGVGASSPLVTAGSGRAYYVGLRAPRHNEAVAAICVLARGTEEGTTATLEHPFAVTANRPVSFTLYSSTIRPDHAGDVVSLRPGEDAQEHTPLVTVLRYGRKSRHVELPVRLSIAFTEVGTLELWCESQASEHRWRLQFQVRQIDDAAEESDGAGETTDAVVSDDAIAAGEQAIRVVFGNGDVTSETLVARLEQLFGFGKTAWPLGVIRRLADVLLAVVDGRRRSAPLEARWLNLLGFSLRPGFGAVKDPWRVAEARKIYSAGLSFPGAIQNRVEWLVLWQRVAGGMSAGQQRELAQRVLGDLGLTGKKAARLNPQVERESWRLLASLERIEALTRVRIGDELVRRIRRDPDNASLLWAIGRLGARVPFHGPLSSVVPPPEASRWLTQLASTKRVTPDLAAAIVQVGARTGDPLRDVDDDARAGARQRLLAAGIDSGALRPLEDIVPASAADASRVFGEPLPDGLRLEVQGPHSPE